MARGQGDAGHSLRVHGSWLTVAPDGVPLGEHGWKLHVSARPSTFPALAEALLPVLLAERCHFKLARSDTALTRINGGRESPAAVGKAVTVYPERRRVRDLGLALARLLRGHEGPRVLSDRRVADDAPVYYRYGPFTTRWSAGPRGDLGIRIPGPDGRSFDAVATLEYRQPPWVTDPFGGDAEPDRPDARGDPNDPAGPEGAGETLGGRFRLLKGIYRAAHGNVFRARDTRSGRRVIVKQARAHVGEGRMGDARTRLRNERRALTACGGLDGVPEFLDHFAHGPDEFLVTPDVGAVNLLDHVRTRGTPPPEAFTRLAFELAATVAALHRRGVLMRDITPRNVVLGGRRAFLVDFGLAALDGVHLPGGTPGFSPPAQLRGEPPTPGDDCFALGMTLAFAVTGLTPVAAPVTRELARQRALQTLAPPHGAAPGHVVGAVGALLDADEERATAALATLAAGRWPTGRNGPGPRPLPAVPPLPREPAAALAERVLELLLAGVEAHGDGGGAQDIGAVDGSVYSGSAGIGLELLHHTDRPGVPEALRALAWHASAATRRVPLAEGLFAGTTGIALFLARAAAAGFEAPDAAPGAPGAPHDDIFGGAAGRGLGALLLADVTGDPAHLAAAREAADALMARDEPLLGVERETGFAPGAGLDPTFGHAHGLAGIVDFLTGLAARTGDPEVGWAAAVRSWRLARRTADLAALAAGPSAVPVAASWCQGMAGAASALAHAHAVLDEPELGRAAELAGDVCAAWVPRMENLSQCCGVAGVGGALLDLAHLSGAERYRAAAERAARHLVARSFGPDHAPELIAPGSQDAPLSFGMGYAGVLTFLRGLMSSGAPGAPLSASAARGPLRGPGHRWDLAPLTAPRPAPPAARRPPGSSAAPSTGA
ncbi:serine/threonine protein kinase [Streptomyces sp. PT12]|nr:serine/threonine protein kinase [Streptomyces sp. PT12]